MGYDGLGDLGFDRRRNRHSTAQIMSHASPALAINSITAIFGSTGSPHFHEVAGKHSTRYRTIETRKFPSRFQRDEHWWEGVPFHAG
jgi:hypothetical protein